MSHAQKHLGLSSILTLCATLLAMPCLGEARGVAPWVGETLDGRQCTGPGTENYGPFDFRIDKNKLPIVENHHFTLEVEQLVRGVTVTHPIRDIRYTLTKIPNHHRALYSAVRFSISDPSKELKRKYPAECFLQRAIHYAPDDPVPHMLYGLYLHRLGNASGALPHYLKAEALSPNDVNLLYNMGLVYFDLGQYAEARRYARQAYAAGVTFPGLQRKLRQAGHWD
ncbi:tetratricopeptide repeat protein [Haliea sp.]